MSQGRHGIKILGLSLLAALGLMAVSAAAAQAGEFKILGNTFSSLGIASEGVLGSGTKGELLTVNNLLLGCTGGTASGTTLLLGGTVHAIITFTGCTVLGNPNCVITPTELDHIMKTNLGTIVAEGLGKLILHENAAHTIKEHYLVAEGLNVPVWFMKPGLPTCLLPLKVNITGSEAFYLPTALTTLLTQKLLTLTAVQRKLLNDPVASGGLNLGIQLLFGAEKADLEVPNETVGMEAGYVSADLTKTSPTHEEWSAE